VETIKVHIKEFGRVRDSELDVLPFVLFSGESGLGKSYMALLCHYFYEVFIDYTRLTNFFKQRNYDYSGMSKDFHNEGVAFTVQKDELEKWLAEDVVSYVGEMLANSSFVGSVMVNLPANIPDDLTFYFKEELTGLVNDEDVLNAAKETARVQFAQYGMNNVPDEYVENYAKEILKKRENVDGLVDRAVDIKLTDALKKVVKLNEKEISLDDFNKMMSE